MAGTTIVAARAALVAALKLRPGLAGAHVTYAWDGDDRVARDAIWTAFSAEAADQGDITASRVPVLRAGTKRREEEYTFVAMVEARTTGLGQQQTDERCVTLFREVEETLAADPYLAIPGLILSATLGGFRPLAARAEQAEHGGRACRIEAHINVRARLL